MPPTAVHGLIGFIFGRAIKQRASHHRSSDILFGAVMGSVIPDLDLVLLAMPTAIYTLLSTGSPDWEAAEAVHRTITHSLISILIIFFLSLVLMARKQARLLQFQARNGKVFSMNIAHVLLGISIGMLIHSTADLFYVSDVALFWPLLPDRYSVVNISFFKLDSFMQRMFAIFDSLPEPFWWLFFVFWSHRATQNFSPVDRKWMVVAVGFLAWICAFFIMALFIPNDLTEPLLTIFLAGAIWMYLLTPFVVWHYKELFYWNDLIQEKDNTIVN